MITIESVPLEAGARTPARTQSFDKAEITIGRSIQADFVLDGDLISRMAVRIVVRPHELVLVDHSENGSTINGCHGWGERPIHDGDDIRLGPYRLTVRRGA